MTPKAGDPYCYEDGKSSLEGLVPQSDLHDWMSNRVYAAFGIGSLIPSDDGPDFYGSTLEMAEYNARAFS